jgi:hypothetical protein
MTKREIKTIAKQYVKGVPRNVCQFIVIKLTSPTTPPSQIHLIIENLEKLEEAMYSEGRHDNSK